MSNLYLKVTIEPKLKKINAYYSNSKTVNYTFCKPTFLEDLSRLMTFTPKYIVLTNWKNMMLRIVHVINILPYWILCTNVYKNSKQIENNI